MSDPSDYEGEAYYDELREQFGKEAVENFTADRLRSFYDREPAVAEKSVKSLGEARRLLQTPHHTAALLHAAIATEVMLRGVVLKPILLGFIHSDSMAPLIVELAISSSGLGRFNKLLTKVFQDVSQIDLMTYVRKGGTRALWDEVTQVQKRRDHMMHRAEIASKEEAEHAVAVATAVSEELFPAFAKSLGYHLHDGFRLCTEWICSQPPEIRKLLEGAQTSKSPADAHNHPPLQG